MFGIGGLEYWTGTLDWTTGTTFDFQIMDFQAEKALFQLLGLCVVY